MAETSSGGSGARLLAWAGIYALVLALSLYRITIPLLEFAPVRQVQTADITRNLYRYDHNPFLPQRYEGPTLKPFIIEFPLYNAAVAGLYGLSGGEHEVLGRLLSIACWIGAGLFMYFVARAHFGGAVALSSLAFFHLSRLGILTSRSFQPDALMMLLGLAALYFWVRWLRTPRTAFLVAATCCGTLAALVKLPIVHLAGPVGYCLLLERSALRRRALWVSVAVTLASVGLWYGYARAMSAASDVAGNYRLDNWVSLDLLADRAYYWRMYVTLRQDVFGSVGFALVLCGLLLRVQTARQAMFHIWVASVLLYLAAFSRHAITHDYYHLPIVAVGAVFAGRAFVAIPDLTARLFVPGRVVQGVVVALAVATTVRFVAPRAYRVPEDQTPVLEAAEAIRRATPPTAVLVTTGPVLAYFADRPSWALPPEHPDPIARLEEFRRTRADVFGTAERAALLENRRFAQYLYSHYPTVAESSRYVVFDLTRPRPESARAAPDAGPRATAR